MILPEDPLFPFGRCCPFIHVRSHPVNRTGVLQLYFKRHQAG
jgi:hypothetical protein